METHEEFPHNLLIGSLVMVLLLSFVVSRVLTGTCEWNIIFTSSQSMLSRYNVLSWSLFCLNNMCILLHHTISIKLRGGGWQRDWGNCTYFSITIWKKNTISISTTPFNLPPPSSLKNVLAKFNLVVLRRYWKCKRLADKRWSEKFTLAFSLGELFACQAYRLPCSSLFDFS